MVFPSTQFFRERSIDTTLLRRALTTEPVRGHSDEKMSVFNSSLANISFYGVKTLEFRKLRVPQLVSIKAIRIGVLTV